MTVLWYAIGIYIVGTAIVLYVRPRIMFREDGMWKEFGLATETDQTIFPFWMFALLWAIVSYALANLLSIFFASVAIRSTNTAMPATATATAANLNASFIQPISSHPNGQPASYITPTTTAATTAKVPGYYILDPYASPVNPRYIYYGMEPPGVTPVAN
jgi:hypothetical protein